MKPLLLLAVLSVAAIAEAREFAVSGLPDGWQAKIEVACDAEACGGPGTVVLSKGEVQQSLRSPDLTFTLPKLPDGGRQLSHEDAPLLMADFNFDGLPDVALNRGNLGPYGSPTADVYVQTRAGRLVYSRELSELTDNYMGMFQVDNTHKLLITFGKSGCCFHVEDHWQVVPGRGLQYVYSREVDPNKPKNGRHTAMLQYVYSREVDSRGSRVEVREKTWRNGRWHQRRQNYTPQEWERRQVP